MRRRYDFYLEALDYKTGEWAAGPYLRDESGEYFCPSVIGGSSALIGVMLDELGPLVSYGMPEDISDDLRRQMVFRPHEDGTPLTDEEASRHVLCFLADDLGLGSARSLFGDDGDQLAPTCLAGGQTLEMRLKLRQLADDYAWMCGDSLTADRLGFAAAPVVRVVARWDYEPEEKGRYCNC